MFLADQQIVRVNPALFIDGKFTSDKNPLMAETKGLSAA
jgi:hypothetical protein